ncbi:MAG TPA: hypothetical protein VGL23_16595, partial [Chloroflexota bacterium]
PTAAAPAGSPAATATAVSRDGEVAVSPDEELARALASPPPKRDVLDLARRFKVRPGTPTPIPTAGPPAQIGDRREFWVADSANKRYFKVTARLLQRSDHVDFYVQESERVDADGVARSIETIEQTILPALAGDFAAGRLALDRLRIAILNTRLRGLVGYYSSVDEYPRWVAPFSNEQPLIAMSLGAVQPGSRAYNSGLAHELEHLIQWRLDRGEDTWVNEGTAELAIRAVGLDPSGNYQAFIQQPDTQLNDWAEEVGQTPAHYGASELFFGYLAQRFGGYSVIGEILARPERGIAGVDAVLRQGAGAVDFASAFVDWTVANWANQPAADARYRYVGGPPVRVREQPIALATRVDASVHQFGARYFLLPHRAGGTLVLETPREAKLVAAPDRPDPIWWSNRSDSGDSRLTRAVDLSGVDRATLHFAAWYDLERDFDYAYVAASIDGGQSWSTLPGRNTSAGDPTGSNYGLGFTGKSGDPAGWVDELVDLSAYAGKKLLLRFETVTDDAYNGAGFCLAGLEIPEIGWRDEPGDAGWTAEGWLRIRNRVPQRAAVQLVAVTGDQVRVIRLPIGQDGRARAAVTDDLAGAERAAIVVSGLTPLTKESMPFALALETE